MLLLHLSCQKKSRMDIWNSLTEKNSYIEFPNQLEITDHYMRAGSVHNTMYKNSARSILWEFVGPDNIAGRILTLAVNPKDTNELWAGTASSGLWKSNSGGIGENAWTNIKLGFPVLSISSIAIDPKNPKIIYIGTGEVYSHSNTDGGKHNRLLRGFWGIGLLKSEDGGQTWKFSINWSNKAFSCFWKIIINYKNTNIIYAAGTEGIYKSEDSGNNWRIILPKKMCNELVMHPLNPDILISGVGGLGGDDYGIFISRDGGNNWKKITDGGIPNGRGRIMISINKNFPDKVFAVLSDSLKTKSLVRTNNLFLDYAISSIPNFSTYQGWYTKGIISNSNAKSLMIGGVDLFVDRSGNYNNFYRYVIGEIKIHADFHDIIANPLDDEKLYFATDGGVFRTDDFGINFYSCNSGLISSQFYSGSFNTTGNFGLGGLQDNRSAIYNGSLSWKKTHYGDGIGSWISRSNNTIYCCSQNLLLSSSKDFGENWNTLIQDENSCFVSPFKVSESNESTIYAGSRFLYKSTDHGSGFNKIFNTRDSAFLNAIEVSSTSSDFILFATIPTANERPSIWKSYDGGKNIDNISSNLPNRIINDINIINNQEYYICLSGFGTPHIYRTTNGGQNWIPIDNYLPDIPINTIWTSPFHPNLIYAGSDLGLYYTLDYGTSWHNYTPQDFDAVPVYDLFYTKSEIKLIIFTHGKGVYKIDPFEIITTTNNSKIERHSKSFLSQRLPDEIIQSEGELISLEGKTIRIHQGEIQSNLAGLNYGIYYYICSLGVYKILHLK
ncbi:MAG: hypothetical protein IT267_03565 [Saprospiraceae bacterium]|nr:hypothetical protein [Saprospiraceae bacterium]